MKNITINDIEKKYDAAINSSCQIVKGGVRRFIGTASDIIIDILAFAVYGLGKAVFGIARIVARNYNRNYKYKGNHEI